MAFSDLFIKKDVPAQPTTSQVKETTAAPVYQPQVNIQPMQTQTQSITLDDKIVNIIWDKIIKENRPGPDYLELKNNVDVLSDLPISDDQKIVKAFELLKKSYPNFKKEDITKAIDFYVSVVNNEKNLGLDELNKLKSQQVDAVESEIKSMQIQAEELKKQYDVLQTKIASRSAELTSAKTDIELKNKAFVDSVESVLGVLESDKQKIMSINF